MNVSKLMDDVKSSEMIHPDGLYLMKRSFENTFKTTSSIYLKSNTEGHVALYDRYFVHCKVINEDTVIFNLGLYDNKNNIHFTKNGLKNYKELVNSIKQYNTLRNYSTLCTGKTNTESETVISKPNTIGQVDIINAIEKLVNKKQYPDTLIVNPTGYSHIRKLAMFNSNFLYGKPLYDGIEFGHFEGLVVVVSQNCPPNFVFLARVDGDIPMSKKIFDEYLEKILNVEYLKNMYDEKDFIEILRY